MSMSYGRNRGDRLEEDLVHPREGRENVRAVEGRPLVHQHEEEEDLSEPSHPCKLR